MRTSDGGGQSEHVQESEQIKIVDVARKRYISRDGVPLYVSVRFNNYRLSKLNRRHMAEAIAELVYCNQPAAGESFDWESRDHPHGTCPECLSALRVRRFKDGRKHFWTTPRSGAINAGVRDTAENAVRLKESKLTQYFQKCDECWLLLVADWERGVSFFEWSDGLEDLRFRTDFSRIHFLDRFANSIHEVHATGLH